LTWKITEKLSKKVREFLLVCGVVSLKITPKITMLGLLKKIPAFFAAL